MKKLIVSMILISLILPASVHAFDLSIITGFFASLFGDDDCSPEIISVLVDPEKVEPGEIMTVTAEITCARDVYALISHEKGVDEVEMRLVDDMWRAEWKEHDLMNEKWYEGFVVASHGDETVRAIFSYQDPTQSHPASEITAGTFDSGNFTFPDSAFITDYVGIGTTSPASLLHLYGADSYDTGLTVTNTGDGSGQISFSTSDVNSDFIINRIGTGGTDISLQYDGDLIIGQQGKVGIGTSNPQQKLDVVGNVNATGNLSGSNLYVGDPSGSYLRVYESGGNWYFQPDAGNVRFKAEELGLMDGKYLRVYHTDNVAYAQLRADQDYVYLYANTATGGKFTGGGTWNVYSTLWVETSCTGAATCNEDVAEAFSASKEEPLEPGDVLIIESGGEEWHLTKSTEAYDTKVAGIFSTEPAIYLNGSMSFGEAYFGNYTGTMHNGTIPLALAGRVPVKTTTENGPIKAGDLLTTSSTPGHAMRCDDRIKCTGAIVGKALESLEEGRGNIRVLVMLA